MKSDIHGGPRSEFQTAAARSGGASRADLGRFAYEPVAVAERLGETSRAAFLLEHAPAVLRLRGEAC